MVMTRDSYGPCFRSLEQNDIYCVGFQDGALQSKDGKDIVLMGGQHCSALANPFLFPMPCFSHSSFRPCTFKQVGCL